MSDDPMKKPADNSIETYIAEEKAAGRILVKAPDELSPKWPQRLDEKGEVIFEDFSDDSNVS